VTLCPEVLIPASDFGTSCKISSVATHIPLPRLDGELQDYSHLPYREKEPKVSRSIVMQAANLLGQFLRVGAMHVHTSVSRDVRDVVNRFAVVR
jgi:hypothetical protein